jgi:hypothetical protein
VLSKERWPYQTSTSLPPSRAYLGGWSGFFGGAIMKEHLKSIIEVLSRDANQLEHHAQKLRRISPDLSVDLKSDAELIDDRAASIRKQIGLLEHWE